MELQQEDKQRVTRDTVDCECVVAEGDTYSFVCVSVEKQRRG